MTDRPGTASGTTEGDTEAPLWRVEGGENDPTGKGLDDTVVRMPKIKADGPPPELPKPPVSRKKGASKLRPFEPGSTVEAPTRPLPAASSRRAGRVPATGPGCSPVGHRGSPYRTRCGSAGGCDQEPDLEAAAHPEGPVAALPVDPWSVMKTSFLFSIAFGIMFWIATSVLWYVVTSSGVFEAINAAIVNIISSPGNPEPWRIEDYVNGNKVLGIAALLAVINVVISTALGTLAAFLYNLSANILGGLKLTLHRGSRGAAPSRDTPQVEPVSRSR